MGSSTNWLKEYIDASNIEPTLGQWRLLSKKSNVYRIPLTRKEFDDIITGVDLSGVPRWSPAALHSRDKEYTRLKDLNTIVKKPYILSITGENPLDSLDSSQDSMLTRRARYTEEDVSYESLFDALISLDASYIMQTIRHPGGERLRDTYLHRLVKLGLEEGDLGANADGTLFIGRQGFLRKILATGVDGNFLKCYRVLHESRSISFNAKKANQMFAEYAKPVRSFRKSDSGEDSIDGDLLSKESQKLSETTSHDDSQKLSPALATAEATAEAVIEAPISENELRQPSSVETTPEESFLGDSVEPLEPLDPSSSNSATETSIAHTTELEDISGGPNLGDVSKPSEESNLGEVVETESSEVDSSAQITTPPSEPPIVTLKPISTSINQAPSAAIVAEMEEPQNEMSKMDTEAKVVLTAVSVQEKKSPRNAVIAPVSLPDLDIAPIVPPLEKEPAKVPSASSPSPPPEIVIDDGYEYLRQSMMAAQKDQAAKRNTQDTNNDVEEEEIELPRPRRVF
ncbi:hypothetical protein ABW20_dc0103779 [Dactylellina cionopaga]|nr:hypothetical protein ABW20_dc0103779 [Dactylellina cionopaga]